MHNRIEFDEEIEIGYINIFNKNYHYEIEETEELEVNAFLNLDIDRKQKIVGIEVFEEEALRLKGAKGEKEIFKETSNGYSFRIANKEVLSKYSFNGLDFCFSKEDYTGFIGLDIVDVEKYPADYVL
ncbi:DUF2283 domain-containing protein [Pontibacillus litoralis]|uniref:DUF2283 domain-containing protein n=1 Tax=Pontibacillus litoralis JSM 072002 TaxID=1385512 RepID=A0A0A5FYC8_9BACI|nr:DUF2283 domain-containing protein [Pontibacillus litoralis]KGX84799.1 hypothetical protein N784_11960 [Pontibacillus litoralis JSM 072002]